MKTLKIPGYFDFKIKSGYKGRGNYVIISETVKSFFLVGYVRAGTNYVYIADEQFKSDEKFIGTLIVI